MNKTIAGIGKTYRNKLNKVLEKNPSILTPKYVSNILEININEAARLLHRWNKNGWINRIKRGSYIPVPINSLSIDIIPEEPKLVIDSLYGNGYFAGFTAIKHWDFTEQIIETIYYFTTKKVKDREIKFSGIKTKIKTIKEYKIFGLKTKWIGSKKIKVSDPTKTIVDILDDPKLVGGMSIVSDVFNEYLNSEHYNFDLLIKYSLEMNNLTILKRLGFLLETKFNTQNDKLEIILNKVTKSITVFDPTVESNSIIKRWGLRVPKSWRNLYDRKK